MEPGVYFITGKLGSGKSALAVAKIFEFLKQGRPVATNLDIYLTDEHYLRGYHNLLTRLPDKPKSAHLESLGYAYTGDYNPDKFGLVVLDECASWFNSRTWADPDRAPLNDWLIHARKYGWNLFFLVQSFDVVDKQARDMLGEYVVHLYNSKKLPIARLVPVRWHIASVYYKMHGSEVRSAVWHFHPKKYFKLYDTRQVFSSFYNKPPYKLKLPLHLEGKSLKKYDWSLFAWTLIPRCYLYLLHIAARIKPGWSFIPYTD